MRRFTRALLTGALSLAGATSALAQAPAEFRSSAELTLSAADALHRFTLPLEAYRDARRDLGDLRVFNAKGEAVPFAIAGDEARPREAATSVTLRAFPVYGAPGATVAADLDVSVRTRSDGTVISVQPRSPASGTARQPTAWLLDASALTSPLQALIVEWDSGPGTEVVHVNVSASDDLRSWQAIASHAALVRVEQGGQSLAQPRVEFPGRRARYLRISGETPAFRLRGARAEMAGDAPRVERALRTVTGVAGEGAGEYVFDLGARLPVEAVRVIFPSQNTVAPVTILSRDSDREEWQRVTAGTFYRLTRAGGEITSPAVDVASRADRYWLLRVDQRSGSIGSELPSVEVAWRPAQVVFVARGEPPFRVAFGSPDAPPAALAVANIMPGYSADAEHRLPVAEVGEVSSVALRGDGMRRLFGEDGGRRLALWSVLVVGVLLLGFMAWKLSRQMQDTPPAS
jgi:hypothetical protein